MNCRAIDAILDDHLAPRLTASERKRAAEHVGACARCAAVWAADDALRRDAIADPAPELLPRLLERVSRAAPRRAVAHRRWWAFAAAAAFTVVALTAWLVVDIEQAASPVAEQPTESAVAASPFAAGRDYEVLPGAMARGAAVAASGAVEVTEFFMYPCFPCYAVEPELERWSSAAAQRVVLTRVPALFNAEAALLARAFYTADVLGKLDSMHADFYDEIHVRGNRLASRATLTEFFARHGVDEATFEAAFDSRDVDARVQSAIALSRDYAITVTPSIVVAGRYVTNPGMARDEMLAVVDHLVDEAACKTRCSRGGAQR